MSYIKDSDNSCTKDFEQSKLILPQEKHIEMPTLHKGIIL